MSCCFPGSQIPTPVVRNTGGKNWNPTFKSSHSGIPTKGIQPQVECGEAMNCERAARPGCIVQSPRPRVRDRPEATVNRSHEGQPRAPRLSGSFGSSLCGGQSSTGVKVIVLSLSRPHFYSSQNQKRGEAPPLPISRLQWFCFSYSRVGTKKKKKRIKKTEFLHKNVAAHTVPGSVSSSSGHFRNPPRLLFCMVKEQNKESKDFYFIHHLIFAWETLLIEWACLFCQVPFIIIYGL